MARETWVQSQVESYQRLKKWYLMPPCLTLSIIRYGSRVKWRNPGKGVAPSPTPWCSKLSKREPSGHPRLWSPTLLYLYDLNFLGKVTFRPDLVCFFVGDVVSGCTSGEGSDESADVSDGVPVEESSFLIKAGLTRSMETVSLLLSRLIVMCLSARLSTLNGPVYVGVRGRLIVSFLTHSCRWRGTYTSEDLCLRGAYTSLAILHCNSWAKSVFGFGSLLGEKYCPDSERGAPKICSAAELPKSSFIVFLSDFLCRFSLLERFLSINEISPQAHWRMCFTPRR